MNSPPTQGNNRKIWIKIYRDRPAIACSGVVEFNYSVQHRRQHRDANIISQPPSTAFMALRRRPTMCDQVAEDIVAIESAHGARAGSRPRSNSDRTRRCACDLALEACPYAHICAQCDSFATNIEVSRSLAPSSRTPSSVSHGRHDRQPTAPYSPAEGSFPASELGRNRERFIGHERTNMDNCK